MERIPYDGNTDEEVIQYFKTRQLQIATEGYIWDNILYKNKYGYIGKIKEVATGKVFDTFYVTEENRGKGYSKKLLEKLTEVITINDCKIVDFLNKAGKKHKVIDGVFNTKEYSIVEKKYGSGCAERSKVFFMNHIDEGMIILKHLKKSKEAMAGFCLHPLVQDDDQIEENLLNLTKEVDPYNLSIAIEYRNIANQYLSKREIKDISEIKLSPIKDVNDMLIADKIQNYKDFLLYHKDSHPRSIVLVNYFENWLKRLNCRNDFIWYMNYSKMFQEKAKIVIIA